MTKVSFCGIGGSGMSALAQILKLKGFEVRGSDRSFDQGRDVDNKAALEDFGIEIFKQDGSAVSDDLDTLYISTAVEETIPDVREALKKGVSIQKRSDLLAKIFHEYKYNVAIGGTSGKTTTTAMLGYVLDVLGKKPCMINGGLLQNYKEQKGIANIIYNNGDTCVIEADESDGSIEKYVPYISVINNISIDHKPINELVELFKRFAERAKEAAVINLDCEYTKEIKPKDKRLVTFSLKDKGADFYASDIETVEDGTKYKFEGKEFKLKLIGKFNVENALCAIACASILGVDKFDAAKALEGFLGTSRRLELVGIKHGVSVIDDFAHNPHKVLGSMSALKAYGGRLIVMFQPHGFTPMRAMGREIIEAYAKYMSNDDMLLMPEIFYAGGTTVRDISSKDLIDYMLKLGKKGYFFETRDEAKKFIIENAKVGDRVVIMGARDNSLSVFCHQILEAL